ncbi:hypothetical protein IscW_ISCW016793 [Ixodes scapularis]|uniref:Uncharacterized protein n=1 Tax=Ixodes scapularis TaxID=6945 RepID=B7PBK9_IXOSC|nr:hypothetical protein IscW_ISCW016793 [Ixodes scapularis]|eukprot:XP_002408415.1 hypothetical protein IscW_ISCW016793 [Ixodes scapularis]
MAPPQNGRYGCPRGPRRGSPYQAPDRARGLEVLASTPLDGVAEPFRGRTAREVDEAADGACLQLPLGSQTYGGCRALFEHRCHFRSANHVAGIAAAPLRDADADAVARVAARVAVDRRFAAAVLKAAPRCAPPFPGLLHPTSWPARSSLTVLPMPRKRKPSR